MQTDISKICADFLRENVLSETNEKLKAAHARELAAAFFGYKSHAALLVEKNYPLHRLEEAEVLVPNIVLMDQRRTRLEGLPAALPDSQTLAGKVVKFLKRENHFSGKVWLYDSLETYVTDILLPENDPSIMDDLAGAMAETNASFDEFPHYEEAEVIEDDDSITISVTGQYDGTPDQDRAYSGDKIDLSVTVELFRVAGRAAFTSPDIKASGDVADWRGYDT